MTTVLATATAIAPLFVSKVPRTSGVYEIRCLANGKFYIGSTVNLRERWQRHLVTLRRSEHHNFYLQQAWNKHGEEQFMFSVLEYVASKDVLVAEQKWLDRTRCTNRRIGFNISALASAPGSDFGFIWEGFIDPAGNPVTIFNLHGYCRQHKLDFPSMHRLAVGKSKLKSYKGWTHKNSVRQRDYVKTYEGFVDPHGNLIPPITNLAAFCREHNLDNTHLLAVMRGRICSHRGWTHINSRKPAIKVHTGYINPEGQRVQIINLVAFCKENGLQVMHMHDIRKGYRKSHKGWTWRPENE
jgi:hypothetical protein